MVASAPPGIRVHFGTPLTTTAPPTPRQEVDRQLPFLARTSWRSPTPMRERPPDTAPAPSAASGADPCGSAQGAVQTLKEYRKNKRLRSRANKAAKRAGGQVFPPPLAMGAPNSKPAPVIADPPGAVLTTPYTPIRPWQKAPCRQTAWKGAKSRGKGKPKGKGKGKVKSKKQGSWPRNC